MERPAPRNRRRRWPWILLGAAVVAWWLLGLAGACLLTLPRPAPIPARATVAGHPVETIETVADRVTLRGWLVRAAPDSRHCVVLAAGIHGNRLAMATRAEWYLAHGWSTLLVDLRGTGQSTPVRIAMGFHEARDLHAWRALLRARGFTTIAAHGQSLGAAAIVYGDGDWAFAVFESCYRDVDSALHARLWWVPFPGLLLWPLRLCSEWLLDVDADELRPVEHIARLRCPTLLLCGADDARLGPDATAALLAACGADDKRAVMLPGVGHQDLLAADHARVTAALAEFVPAAR